MFGDGDDIRQWHQRCMEAFHHKCKYKLHRSKL